MGVHDVAETGFGAGADAYERGRPSYPDDVVRWLSAQLAITTGSRVADVAAGTGKLTRLLTGLGADIVAVEPVAAMRAKLEDSVDGVEVIDGTAENLPFEDGSIDAVTVAQAFHWFDGPAALAEIGRVLRPGGGLGVVWNERDSREPWVAELSRLIRWDERGRWRVPYTLEIDWGQRLSELGGPFTPPERYDTRYLQAMDPDTLVNRVLSTSYLASLPGAEQAELADRVRALVAPLGEHFDLPYVTVAWAARRT